MTAELVAVPGARAALEGWLEGHGTLIDAAASAPDSERLRGRGRVLSVARPDGPAGRWVVRHYHRGGALAGVLGDRYVRGPLPRPLREFRLLRALETLGVPAVRPVGAAVYPAGPFYRGDLVTEWASGSRDLARVLFGMGQLEEPPGRAPGGAGSGPAPAAGTAAAHRPRDPSPEDAMRAAGALVRCLHDAGVLHPDLNLKNILVTNGLPGVRALAVDLDRARIRARIGDRARRRMLERFERSLRKWEDRAGSPAPAGAREAFRAGYDDAR